jgi:hypothetical protein
MPVSETYLFKNCVEYVPIARIRKEIPSNTRGVYVLYNSPDGVEMNVVYIGMSRGEKFGVGSRLGSHARTKIGHWTHFSVYEVWDNITKSQVEELEGLFRHVYARDKNANKLNVQKRSKIIASIKRKSDKWLTTGFSDGLLSKPLRRDVVKKTRRAVRATSQVVKKR